MKLVLLAALALVYSPTRPPALTQSDVPFTYDPNQVSNEILSWHIVAPGQQFLWRFKACDPDGDTCIFTHNLVNSPPNVYFFQGTQQVYADPNDASGVAMTNKIPWDCRWNVEGVKYIDVTVTDGGGGTDTRTILVYVTDNKPPVLQ